MEDAHALRPGQLVTTVDDEAEDDGAEPAEPAAENGHLGAYKPPRISQAQGYPTMRQITSSFCFFGRSSTLETTSPCRIGLKKSLTERRPSTVEKSYDNSVL